MYFNKKGSEKVFNTIISLVLALIFLAVVTTVIIKVYSGPSITKTSESISCYVTNGLASAPLLGRVMTHTCGLHAEDESADKARLAEMLVGAWFMYGRGRWDIEHSVLDDDKTYPVYSFKLSEEFTLDELYHYLAETSDGTGSSYEDSDYNYLQEGSKGQSICVDFGIKDTMKSTFNTEQQYFILFYDDEGFYHDSVSDDCGDKVVISLYPNYDQGEPYYCPTSETKSVLLIKDNKCIQESWGDL